MEIVGKVKMIGAVQDVSPTFRKRELVVTTEEQYPQHILIEFTQDKCDLLNGIQIGETIKVALNLRGREWVNPQGETRYFNSIQGWRIESANQQQNYQQAPQQNYGQQPQQGYMQQPQQGYTNTGYHGNGSATQAYFNQQSQQQNHPQQKEDDLPF